MIGMKLAHFEITSHLGTGGMGEVYEATDSKLGRSVAIKLLPEALRTDADRAARFELYYVSGDFKLMAVPVSFGGGTLNVGSPEQLWERFFPINDARAMQCQPSADGQKFLAAVPAEGAEPPPATIWMNWMAGLKQIIK